ncbi:LPS assembly lipoprotein LptE [Marinobacter sp. M216]|uniref:LPS-assembly lipoprotein LptE n=1 Tax=Marinobacter albus TaxID=3030833 RepID=A0ABT7HA06_9GAMM|nr:MULTISPECIES: LPS assembly lipoprotein LptE [unclassified Marinobacter]MBW7470563.1 hypothetical protein [Marinobacter sp. F4218]MDK9557169.1 LPS assembly lipoprotein LptE [Marinobacter sp. M216]
MPHCPAMKSTALTIMAAALAALLTGCGFQLRGAPPVSSALQPLAVECTTDVPDTLCQSVLNQLELGEVELSPAADAAYVMQLSGFQENRRASAITVQAAAAEYTLRHSVNIELISADRVPMIGDTRLTASESYRYDETNVLAKQREEEELRMQLSDRLAQQVIFRLAPLTEARIQTIREQHQATASESDGDTSTP